MQISPMLIEHIPKVHEIEKECFSDPWSIASIESEHNDSANIRFVAMVDDDVAGYGMMFVTKGIEANIENMAVKHNFRRQGIADELLAALVTAAGGLPIYLEVRANNVAAQELYKKHGFVAKGLRKEYYRKPTEDAIIMQLEGDDEKT